MQARMRRAEGAPWDGEAEVMYRLLAESCSGFIGVHRVWRGEQP